MSKTRLIAILSVFLSLNLSLPTAFAAEKNIQIKGSDTMVNLGQAWAEEFMHSHPDITLAVTGGGSGTGVTAIINGTCDIAQSSREMTEDEKAKAGKTGEPIHETIVAHDGIAVIVHPSNPLSQITMDQLADIFSGKVKNWKEIGGSDLPILVLSRERNSGTHIFFLEHVVRKGNAKGPEEFVESALMMPASQSIAQEVETSEAGIGYVGIGYVTDKQKVLGVGKTAAGPFVHPSVETVLSKEYPISRPLYFFTHGAPKDDVKTFTDFVLSPEGQEIVTMLDFVPVE